MKVFFYSSLAIVSAMFVSGCNEQANDLASPVQNFDAGEADWASHGGGINEGNFSRLDAINVGSVSRLGLAWSLDLDGEQSLEATPLAVDGVLYFAGSKGDVYAVDAVSGRQLWKFDAELSKYMADRMWLVFAVNRGVAYADGKIFVGTLDGRLVALNSHNGKVLWSVLTVTRGSKQTITGAPRVFKGKVVIGNGGGDSGARGYLTAYDAASGRQAWRFYTAPGRPEENAKDPTMSMAAKTWSGKYWETGTGGTVWDSVTYDPELDRLYIGTGNSGPYNPAVRSPGNGDNLFLASIVAVNPDTGRYIWHYQVNPREAWDYKATSAMIATTLKIDGKPRKVLMQSPTNGFFYVIDRVTGKLISAEKTGKVTWASRIDVKTGRPVEAPNIRYENGPVKIWPSPFGTHNWQRMSYSPSTGLVYIPYMQLGAQYSTVASKGGTLVGGASITPVIEDGDDAKGALVAWDPAAQKMRWKVRNPTLWNGGVLSTGGDLVFQGTAEGWFNAYDANDGKKLWGFDAKHGIIAAPISYLAHGKQYVSVLAGYGGGVAFWSKTVFRGWKFGAQPRRLLTFVLDGKGKLPATNAADPNVHAVDDPRLVLSEDRIERGARIYERNCAVCHGGELLSAGVAPDLRESGVALDFPTFNSVVRGALLTAGMPKFEKLSEEEIGDVHQYIRAGAREVLGSRRQSGAKMTGSSRF